MLEQVLVVGVAFVRVVRLLTSDLEDVGSEWEGAFVLGRRVVEQRVHYYIEHIVKHPRKKALQESTWLFERGVCVDLNQDSVVVLIKNKVIPK